MRVLDRSVVVARPDQQIGLRAQELDTIEAPARAAARHRARHRARRARARRRRSTRASTASTTSAIKIITTEDPVEYDLDGIIQIQVNEEIGVTYANVPPLDPASGPRHHPGRRDPRPRDGRRSPIEASLTGHLVFSTLHTNDAPLAVTRLLDLGDRALPGGGDRRGHRRPAPRAQGLHRLQGDATSPSPDVLAELELKPERGRRQPLRVRRGLRRPATARATRAAWRSSRSC